jgi:hypothetical protein
VAAHGVILMVIDGSRGSEFSVQTTTEIDIKRLPAMLRTIADRIEEDLNG